MAELKYMTDYHTKFDPKAYLAMYYRDYKGNKNEEGLEEFHLRAMHSIWAKIELRSRVRCLEYGGGPCISNLISASPKVDRIVFAEYTEANRQAVVSWIAGSSETHDWSPLITFVVGDLQGVQGDANITRAVSKREEEVKRKIKSIVPCDVTKNPIVDLESVDQDKPFDVVTTSLCLEVCVKSEKQYKNGVSSLCKFLKPDGYFMMYGILGETFYIVGEEKFHTFPLTKAMVVEAMKEGGLEDIHIETLKMMSTMCIKFSWDVCSLRQKVCLIIHSVLK